MKAAAAAGGGMALPPGLGFCRVGAIVCVERPGPLASEPIIGYGINAIKPSGAEARSSAILDELGSAKRVHTSFSACSDGLATAYGRRPTLVCAYVVGIINTILPESLSASCWYCCCRIQKGRNVSALLYCYGSMHV